MSAGDAATPASWSRAEIAERVLEIVRTHTQHPVSIESTFDSIGLDSLAMAEIIFEIESVFKIRADERLLDMQSMQEVVNMIENLVPPRAASHSN